MYERHMHYYIERLRVGKYVLASREVWCKKKKISKKLLHPIFSCLDALMYLYKVHDRSLRNYDRRCII